MQDKKIKEYIDKLNREKGAETIFIRPISKYVKVARVWDKVPELDNEFFIEIPSYKFFFIINDDGKNVGAVLDMSRDLHWFILEEERKKGHLTKALKEAIIPYLFYDEYDERDIQRITIDKYQIGEKSYENSKRVAIEVGFQPVNDKESVFELDSEKFNWDYENLEEINSPISEERIVELRKRVLLAYRQLIKVSDELLMAYDDDKNLREDAMKIRYYNMRLKDLKWEKEKS